MFVFNRPQPYFFDPTFNFNSNIFLLNDTLAHKSFDSSFFNLFFFQTNIFDFYKNITNLDHLKQSNLYLDDNFYHSDDFFYEPFFFLKNSSYISFFLTNMVDVPVCFKKSKSLQRRSFELPILKLFNLITLKGKKEKTFKILFKNYFNSFFNKNFENGMNDFFYIYLTSLNFFFNSNKSLFVENDPSFLNKNGLLSETWFKDDFLKILNKIIPVFAYHVYSVDKNVRKYSRGKSGKYIFVWKYIAPYKRQYQALRWIAKELKFRFEKKFYQRFNAIMYNLNHEIRSTFIWKSKTFSHNYVFKNFKKSLMSTLLTIAK